MGAHVEHQRPLARKHPASISERDRSPETGDGRRGERRADNPAQRQRDVERGVRTVDSVARRARPARAPDGPFTLRRRQAAQERAARVGDAAVEYHEQQDRGQRELPHDGREHRAARRLHHVDRGKPAASARQLDACHNRWREESGDDPDDQHRGGRDQVVRAVVNGHLQRDEREPPSQLTDGERGDYASEW